MFEQLGLGVRFEFQNYGHSDLLNAMSDMNGLYDVARQSGEVFSSMQQNFETTTNYINSFAKGMVATGTAMTTAFTLGLRSSAKFESELAGLKKYMSDTSATGISEFNKALSSSAQELGVAKTEIMEATQEYMAMGLAQDKALEMASAVTKAGKIWDVASQEAAEAFKGISAAYNMDFVESEEVRNNFVDLINYVADNTALVGKDSLNFLSAAGASLKTMGNTSMEGALGIASAAAKAQVDITHLGYGMNTMIRRYSDKGETYFKTVGLEAKDAAGNLKPFNEMLDELAKKVQAGAIDTTKLSDFASNLGGVYASDLLRIINAWSEYDKTMNAIASGDYAGSAQREWETITATFEHQANITKVIWSDFIQATFGQILPIVTKFVQGFNKAFSAITNFLSAHPKIAAFGTALVGIAGIALVLGGSFILLSTKISQWMISLSIAEQRGYSFSGMLNVMRLHLHNAAAAVPMLLKNLLSIGVTFGLVYLTMKYDILGIRSMFEKFVSTIRNSFNESKNLIQSSAQTIALSLHSFDNSDSLADHLTAMFARVGIAWQALREMWTDYTLSDEMYDKLVASGMLPVVTAIMMLVYRLREAWRGFKDGFLGMCEIIRNVIQNVLAPPFNWIKEHIIIPAVDAITQFMIKVGLMSEQSSLLTSASSKWYSFGKAIGSLAPFAVLIGLVKKMIDYAGILKVVFSPLGKLLASPFKLLFNILGKLGGGFSSLIGWFSQVGISIANLVRGNLTFARFIAEAFPRLGTLIANVGSVLSTVGSAISTVFGAIQSAISAVVSAIGGAISAVGAPVIIAIVAVIASVVSFAVKFKEQFMNIIGTVKDTFFNVVGGIADKFGSVIGAIKDRIEILKTFFAPAFENIKEAVGNVVSAFSSLKDGIVKVVQTPQVQSFLGVLVDILATVGAVVTSVVIPAFNFLQTVLGALVELVIGVVGSAINGLIDAFTGLASGIVNVFSGIINVVSGVINTIVGLISGLVTGDFSQLKEGLSQIGQGILQALGGVGEAVVGIFGGIIDFLGGVVSSFWDAGCNIVQGLIDGIISIGQNIWNSLTAVFQSIIDGVKSLFGIASPSTVMAEIGGFIIQGLINGITALVDGVISIFTGIADTITGIIDGIGSFLSGAWDGITSVASAAWEGLKGVASSAWDGITSTIKGAVEGVGSFLSGAWDGIKSVASSALEGLKGAASTAWDGIKTTIGNVADGIGEKLSGAWDGIKSAASSAWDTVSSTASSAWEGIKSTVGGIADSLGEKLSGAWENIKSTASSAWDNVKSTASSAWDGIKGVVGGVWDSLTGKTSESSSSITTVTSTAFNGVKQVASDVFNSLPESVQTGLSAAGSVISTTVDGIKSAVSTTFEGVKTTVTDIASGISTNMSTAWESIKSSTSTAWSGIKDGVSTAVGAMSGLVSGDFSTMKESVSTIMGGVKTAVGSAWNGLTSAVGTVVSTHASNVKTIFSGLSSGVTSIASGLKSSVSTTWSSLKDTVSSTVSTLASGVTSHFNNLKGSLSTAVSNISSNMTSGFNSMKSSVTTAVSGIVSSVSSKFSGLASSAASFGSNMVSGFVSGIQSMAGKVASAASNIVNTAKQYIGFHSPSKKGEGRHIIEWGANMIGGFIDGIDSAVPALQNTMAKVIQSPNLVSTVNAVSGTVDTSTSQMATPVSDYDAVNRGNIENIYNNRSDVSNNQTTTNNNGGGVNLTFGEGAFKFEFAGVGSSDVQKIAPDMQNYIQQAILDTVKKLKNQQYEK